MKSHALRRVEFVIASPVNIFGDLREREAIEFAEALASRRAPRLTAILGEPGVGKTYFCEIKWQRGLKLHTDLTHFSPPWCPTMIILFFSRC